MCLCLLSAAENIYLVTFQKCKLSPKPCEAYLKPHVCRFCYLFIVLMQLFQKIVLYYSPFFCSGVGSRNENFEILFLKERQGY